MGATTGASSDFQQATNIATQMISKWGMDNEIGKVYVSDDDQQHLSTTTRERMEDNRKKLLEERYEYAKSLLIQYKQQHERLTNALIEVNNLFSFYFILFIFIYFILFFLVVLYSMKL